ncbi:MAG TPA: TetR/AcrR family transcriptional regulator [Phycisphaerales bacterium]|nr:TetR/AcrR family transcriptional regulator [Phycisphaerales bacterium]
MSRMPAAKRREQLLDTAAKLFATQGYAGATTSQIARTAGVTEPIIYRHFASKRELFIALIERTGEDTIKLWEHELSSAPEPAERIKRLIRANPMVTHKSGSGRGVYRVIIQAMTEVEDPSILEAVTKHIYMLHGFLSEEIRKGQESGQVPQKFSPEVTAWALIHLGLGYGTLSAMGLSGHGIDQRGNHVQDLIGELMLGDRYRAAAAAAPAPAAPDAPGANGAAPGGGPAPSGDRAPGAPASPPF